MADVATNDVDPAWLKMMADYQSNPQQSGFGPQNLMAPGQQLPPQQQAAQPAPVNPLSVTQVQKPPVTSMVRGGGSRTKTPGAVDPNVLNSDANSILGLKPIQDQQASLDQLKQLIMKNAQGQDQNSGWIRPLLALADSMNGTKLEQGYTAPSPQEQNKSLLGSLEEIQKRKQDISKDALTGISAALKNGPQVTIQNGNMGQGVGAQDHTFDKVNALLTSMRGDPSVQQAEKDLYASAKAKTLSTQYGDPNNLPPQMVNLLVNELGKIAQGGSPTMSELEGLRPGTLRGELASVYSKLTNNPTPANAGEFIKQYMDYANNISKDAQNQIVNRATRIIEPYKSHLQPADYQNLKDQYVNRFDNAGEAPQASGGKAPATAAAPIAVTNSAGKRGSFKGSKAEAIAAGYTPL